MLAGAVALSLAATGQARGASLPDVAVTPNEPGAFQQPSLSVDPTNPKRFAIGFQEGLKHQACRLARSSDGGRTWRVESLVGTGTAFPPPQNYPRCYDPLVAYGPDGTLYYQYEVLPGTNPLIQRKVFVTTSRDGGPFAPPLEVDPVGPGTDHTDLYSEMAVDRASGQLYVTFLRYCEPGNTTPMGVANCTPNPGKVVVASSGDRGQTFSPPLQVNTPAIADPSRPSIAVDAGGTVYSSFTDGFLAPSDDDRPPTLYVASSRDQGRTFASPKSVSRIKDCSGDLCYAPESGGGFFHTLGGSPGQLFVAYWERQENGRYRILFTTTHDGGATFTTPRVVGVPAGGEGHDQHRPRLALGPGGRVYLAYYDYSPQERLEDVYMIESSDGGGSFSTPRKLTDVRSNSKVGSPGKPNHANFGQDLGIASTSAGPLVAWTDSRRGTSLNGKQDIFFEGQALAGAGRPAAGRRCVSTRGGIKGTGVGVARLGRTRAGQRKVLKGTLLSDRPKIDRYCVNKGGGSLRVGYPTSRLASKLSRGTRRRIGSKAILLVSTSKAFKLSRSMVGTKTGTLRRRLRGERRVKVGRNTWYVAKGRKARVLFRTRKGKVLEMGIADRRLTTTRAATVRLLRAWDKRGKTRK